MSTKRNLTSAQDADVQRRVDLAKQVKGYRAYSELGVNEAAKEAGIHRSRWSAVEAASTAVPEPNNIAKMARAIGAPKHELLRAAGYDDEADVAERIATRETDPDIAELVDLARGILEVKRRLVEAHAQLEEPAPPLPPPARRASKPRPRAAHRVEDPS